jgi:hypothetical protein
MDEAPKKFAVSLDTIVEGSDHERLLEHRKHALENPETRRAVASVRGAPSAAPSEPAEPARAAPAVLPSPTLGAPEQASADASMTRWRRAAMIVAALLMLGAPLLTWLLGRSSPPLVAATGGADRATSGHAVEASAATSAAPMTPPSSPGAGPDDPVCANAATCPSAVPIGTGSAATSASTSVSAPPPPRKTPLPPRPSAIVDAGASSVAPPSSDRPLLNE